MNDKDLEAFQKWFSEAQYTNDDELLQLRFLEAWNGALLYERKRSELKQVELERLVVHMGREMQKERDQKELLIQALEKIASNWSEDYREDAYQALQKVKK